MTTRYHRHKCRRCGCIWEHEDRLGRLDSDEAVASNVDRHRCPKCRGLNFHKHFGAEPCHVSTRPLAIANRRYKPVKYESPTGMIAIMLSFQDEEFRRLYEEDDANLESQGA